MAVSKSWLRVGAAVLLGLGLGCHHSGGNPNTYTLDGGVSYTRVPLNIGTDGVPTGLQTDPNQYLQLPARGVAVRAFQGVTEQDVYGNITTAWMQAGSAVTDVNGNYYITNLQESLPTFVELDSVSSAAGTVKLVADPAGVDSLVPEPGRAIYVMRKGVDGSTSTTSATPGVIMTGNGSVNFTVGLKDAWLLAPVGWNNPTTGPFPYPPTITAGSRVLAILDDVYAFASSYGNPTPSNYLDLHYNPNVTNPRGSFVEYNRSVYPLSFDGTVYHYFGTINGETTVNNVTYPDDAFYSGVTMQILGRNHLFAQDMSVLYPTGAALTDLTPPQAVIEGLSATMAAGLLQSPFLPDATNPARFPPVDIRDLSALTPAQQSAYSAPTIAALGWNMILVTNGLTPPATPAQWPGLIPGYLNRLWTLVRPTVAVGKFNVARDVNSIYAQLGRMQEVREAGDVIDLSLYFTDPALTSILAPFNLPWPGTAALPQYSMNWGMDPNSLVSGIPTFTLSMNKAQMVRGTYPNNSEGEVFYATFTASVDHTYALGVSTVPPLPVGAILEVTVDPAPVSAGVYLYGGANPATNTFSVNGNYGDLTNPVWHYLQIRIVSPTILQPDLAVTMQMPIVSPANPNVSPNSPGSN